MIPTNEGEESKYTHEAKAVLMSTQADAVLLIVLGGKDGEGAVITAEPNISIKKLEALPKALAMIAENAKRDVDKWIASRNHSDN